MIPAGSACLEPSSAGSVLIAPRVADETHPHNTDNMFELMTIGPTTRPSTENYAIQANK